MTEAVILAGGLGTRLRSVIRDLPKPLAPVCGRPFLFILLERLATQGVSNVVLSVGYRHELVREAVGGRFAGMSVDYAVEDAPLGTGGAIRLALQKCSQDPVLVMNGDTFVDLHLGKMLEFHRSRMAKLTVAAVHVENTERYGSLILRENEIIGFAEKGRPGSGYINAGVYLMDRDLLADPMLPDKFSFETDILEKRLELLHPLAHKVSGAFVDIGVPADYIKAQKMFETS